MKQNAVTSNMTARIFVDMRAAHVLGVLCSRNSLKFCATDGNNLGKNHSNDAAKREIRNVLYSFL